MDNLTFKYIIMLTYIIIYLIGFIIVGKTIYKKVPYENNDSLKTYILFLLLFSLSSWLGILIYYSAMIRNKFNKYIESKK